MSTTTIASTPTVQVRPSVVPVVPDTAPFTPAQRAWLNGFLAGMVGGQVASAAVSGEAVAAQAPAPVVESPAAEEEFPWHDPAMSLADRLKLAEGKPRERVMMAAMAQLDCGACGYLCKTYAEAISSGAERDLTRCSPGGRDTAKALKQLTVLAPSPQAKAVPATDAAQQKAAKPAGDRAAYDRNNPYPARLARCVPLNGSESVKDTRLVVLDLKDSGVTYKPGDALGVFPENCPELVQEILEALHASGAEDVPGWDGLPISLHEALLREFTITRPTPDLMDLLSRCAREDAERDALKAMRDDEAGAGDLHVLDLLRQFTSAIPAPGDFVATLSPLAPRLYSISSSLAAHPQQVHLTVGTVRYKNKVGRTCGGVTSTFLADRIRPGQKVRVFIHPSHKFALPANDRPIIMVGPGTGIAPFRAFLQERAAVKATGKSWLIFGDQHSSCDYLYRDEIEKYQKEAVLTHIDTAFSRDQEEKHYVQHKMLENAARIWEWLAAEGAYFYVCGDAKRMAGDVDRALRQIIAEQGDVPPAEADKFIAELVRAGRYQRDVY